MLPVDNFRHDDRMIQGLDGTVPEVENLLLDGIQPVRFDTCRRQDGPTALIGYAHHNVSAPEVVEIVGERADRVQNIQGIPPRLELQPLPLDGFTVQQHFNGYRQVHSSLTLAESTPKPDGVQMIRPWVRLG